MFLRYILQPHFLKGETFPVDRPVSGEKEADQWVKHLQKRQNQKVTRTGFMLLDMHKRVVKIYRKVAKELAPNLLPKVAENKLSKRR